MADETTPETTTDDAAPAEAAPEAAAAEEAAAPAADATPEPEAAAEAAPAADEAPAEAAPAAEGDAAAEASADGVGDEAEAPGMDEAELAKLVQNPPKDARYYSTGKRKTSVARVTVTPGKGTFWINGRDLDTYFPRHGLRVAVLEPLTLVGGLTSYDVRVRLHGGGVSSQAGALRHGLSRALAEIHPEVRTQLKGRGFLKLDARQVERKKAGFKKARKRPQFSKR
jgi:small subunit ribosomal protein S9